MDAMQHVAMGATSDPQFLRRRKGGYVPKPDRNAIPVSPELSGTGLHRFESHFWHLWSYT